MKETEHQGGRQLSEQREFDEAVSKLANVNYEMFIRALVHLEGQKLTEEQYDVWLRGEGGYWM